MENEWLGYSFEIRSYYNKKPAKEEIKALKVFAKGFIDRFKCENKEDYEFNSKKEEIDVDYIANPFKEGYIVRMFIRTEIKVHTIRDKNMSPILSVGKSKE